MTPDRWAHESYTAPLQPLHRVACVTADFVTDSISDAAAAVNSHRSSLADRYEYDDRWFGFCIRLLNPLDCGDSYFAASINWWSVHLTCCWLVELHLVQRGGDWAAPQPAQSPLGCIKCDSTHQQPRTKLWEETRGTEKRSIESILF